MKHDPIVTQMVIETDRFVLRPLRRSDMGKIGYFASDERVARMTTSVPHPLPPGAAESFVTRFTAPDRAEDVWVMDSSAQAGEEFMGLIALERMDRNQSEIGYWVAPPFWNDGVAQRAVEALVTTNPRGNDAIFASVFQDNPASAKVLTNIGFVYLGDAESFCVARDATVPTWTYSKKLR